MTSTFKLLFCLPQSSNGQTIDQAPLLAAQPDFQSQVEQAMKRTPRFIFRFWHSRSGGNSELNTITAITPLAFLRTGAGSQSFYELGKDKITSLANMHLTGGRHAQTVFSSWSQSLPFVLAWAMRHRHDPGVHISILDTSKLAHTTIVLHTKAMSKIMPVHGLSHELLAFGVITGDMYEAVPLSRLLRYGIEQFTDRTTKASPSEDTVNAAIGLGLLFGGDFAAAFAAHLIGLRCKDISVRDMVLGKLCNLAVPLNWSKDQTIMTDNRDTSGFVEADAAADLLRDLVIKKHNLHETRRSKDREMQDGQAARPKRKKSIFGPQRIPREVQNLYIDLIGWEHIAE